METQKFELIKDAIGYSIPSTALGKINVDPKKSWLSKTMKLNGRIVYIRTADGFRKMIETTLVSPYKYFDADSVKLIGVANANLTSSFSGNELSNANMLDENFSNISTTSVSSATASKTHKVYGRGESTSNTVGDFFTNLFGGTSKPSAAEAKVLTDPKKVVYTEAEAKKLHAGSGSTTPFKDWLKKDSTINFLTSLTSLGAAALIAKSTGGLPNTNQIGDINQPANEKPTNDDKNNNTGEKWIMNLHPVTFAIGSLVILTGAFFTVRYFVKHSA